MSSQTEPAIVRQHARKSYVLPRHRRQPGEDGYRTPVIEDPEHPAHHGQRHLQFAHGSSTQVFRGLPHSPLQTSSSGLEHTSHSEKSNRSRESDRCYLPEGFPGNLNWRQRIKHVTWAYFTLTMATGGIQLLPGLLDTCKWN
jgi:hypothetical protein